MLVTSRQEKQQHRCTFLPLFLIVVCSFLMWVLKQWMSQDPEYLRWWSHEFQDLSHLSPSLNRSTWCSSKLKVKAGQLDLVLNYGLSLSYTKKSHIHGKNENRINKGRVKIWYTRERWAAINLKGELWVQRTEVSKWPMGCSCLATFFLFFTQCATHSFSTRIS